MAERYDEFLSLGTRLVAVDIDSPGQHAAMVEKLALPFPYLSDPDRDLAIGPLGLRDERDQRELARPAVVLFDRSGQESWRWEARDYADRIDEQVILDAAAALDLAPVAAEEVRQGVPEPGPSAVSMDTLHVYFRGARFAVVAMRRRHPDMRDDGLGFIDEMDRFAEVLKARRDRSS